MCMNMKTMSCCIQYLENELQVNKSTNSESNNNLQVWWPEQVHMCKLWAICYDNPSDTSLLFLSQFHEQIYIAQLTSISCSLSHVHDTTLGHFSFWLIEDSQFRKCPQKSTRSSNTMIMKYSTVRLLCLICM